MTQLQVALDGNLADSLQILESIRPYIDIAEIGTPLIFREGMHAVQSIHATFPDLPLLADLKIMDAGAEEAQIAFNAGCKFVTVLGVASDATLQAAIQVAEQMNKQTMVDLMQVQHPIQRAKQLLEMGCDILCVHTAYDLQQHQNPLLALQTLRKHFPEAQIAVAGGIGLYNLDDILASQPTIVIVGGAITKATHPAQITQTIQKRTQQYD